MAPRSKLADVGHFIYERVQPSFGHGPAKGRFVHPRRACGNYNAVQLVFTDTFSNFLLAWIGTGVTVCLNVNDVWEFTGVFGHFFNVHCAGDVEPTVTNVDAYARLLCLCWNGCANLAAQVFVDPFFMTA